MPLHLNEAEVAELVDMSDAIQALEDSFAAWGDVGTVNLPRRRLPLLPGQLHVMPASWKGGDVCGVKAYCTADGRNASYLLLFSQSQVELLAIIEISLLGKLRTGAASAIATRRLARSDASTLGLIGTGRQAWAQAHAICAVRPIKDIRVFSRTPEKREAMAARLVDELGVSATAVDSAEACVTGADVVATITNAAEPVFRSEWLSPGVHVNAAGANSVTRRELDDETVLRASVLVTDDRDQARLEGCEFNRLAEAGKLSWDDVGELGDLVGGKLAGRRSDADITIFKSLGIALEDIALGAVIYRRAMERGVGRRF